MREQAAPLILNVDDDPGGRYVISRVLRHAGYQVAEAASIGEARRMIAGLKPGLVLLDIKLPDGDGFEYCRELKTDPRTANTLVVQHSASYVRPADHARGLDIGADAYIALPVDADVLLATVRSLLRLRAAEHALRESARGWRVTFDALSDAVALLDAGTRITRCNRALSTLLDLEFPAILGQRWSDLLPGLPVQPFDSVLAPGAPPPRVDVEARHEGRWMRLVADPVWSADGSLEGMVCVLSDIEERKHIEEERRTLLERERIARAEAEAASRAKDEFLAVLSHELRTPLNAVLGWARMLRSGSVDAGRVDHALQAIERNAAAQAQLIEDLLDVSRAISGHLHLDAKPLALEPIARSAIDVVQLAADAKNVNLSLTSEDTGLQVIGDGTRLRQVIWNLLSNAVKFTPAGGEVQVTVARRQDLAEIVVRDTGVGISPAFLPHVFDRFRQADTSVTRSHSGLGLGLAIVRHLVESHGGRVEAASEGEGKGATFTVRLPAL
jgi:PAS domain S-box-containing protein